MEKIIDKNGDATVVDMYELPMAKTYFDTGDKDTYVYFDIFSGAIQTYVFCMLTVTFVANKREAVE